MNIKEELTCNYCNEIFNIPIALPCGDSICKHHIEELTPSNSSNKFKCPLCDKENSNQNLEVNKVIENLLKRGLHEFRLESKYENSLSNLKTEIKSLEKIIRNPENYIYEQISEFKRRVDLDKERLKSEIDNLANDFIQQLNSHEASFTADYKSHADLDYYNRLVESSKKQLTEYENYLYLFSIKNEQREEKCKENEKLSRILQLNVKKLKTELLSNSFLTYAQVEKDVQGFFGKLIHRVSK